MQVGLGAGNQRVGVRRTARRHYAIAVETHRHGRLRIRAAGHGMHRYQFTAWALPQDLEVKADTPPAMVGYMLNAMALGIAPPMPIPQINRAAMREVSELANTISRVRQA